MSFLNIIAQPEVKVIRFSDSDPFNAGQGKLKSPVSSGHGIILAASAAPAGKIARAFRRKGAAGGNAWAGDPFPALRSEPCGDATPARLVRSRRLAGDGIAIAGRGSGHF